MSLYNNNNIVLIRLSVNPTVLPRHVLQSTDLWMYLQQVLLKLLTHVWDVMSLYALRWD